jgi:hypothetical protein
MKNVHNVSLFGEKRLLNALNVNVSRLHFLVAITYTDSKSLHWDPNNCTAPAEP